MIVYIDIRLSSQANMLSCLREIIKVTTLFSIKKPRLRKENQFYQISMQKWNPLSSIKKDTLRYFNFHLITFFLGQYSAYFSAFGASKVLKTWINVSPRQRPRRHKHSHYNYRDDENSAHTQYVSPWNTQIVDNLWI